MSLNCGVGVHAPMRQKQRLQPAKLLWVCHVNPLLARQLVWRRRCRRRRAEAYEVAFLQCLRRAVDHVVLRREACHHFEAVAGVAAETLEALKTMISGGVTRRGSSIPDFPERNGS